MTEEEALTYADEIKSNLLKELNESLKGKPMNLPIMTAEIVGTFQKNFSEDPLFDQTIFSIKSELCSDTIIIHANNLYSLLWLYGETVPYEEVRDKTYWITSYGTYKFENGQSYFQLNKPIEYVTVNFTLPIEE